MSGLSHYYNRAKGGLMNINPKDAVEHGESMMIAAGTGLGLGLISASIGGLDKNVAGMPVPIDGVAALGLAAIGLSIRSPELLTASIAATGSAATRSGEKFFRKALNVHGDFDGGDIPFGFGGYEPANQLGSSEMSYGWGYDPIVEHAKAANF